MMPRSQKAAPKKVCVYSSVKLTLIRKNLTRALINAKLSSKNVIISVNMLKFSLNYLPLLKLTKLQIWELLIQIRNRHYLKVKLHYFITFLSVSDIIQLYFSCKVFPSGRCHCLITLPIHGNDTHFRFLNWLFNYHGLWQAYITLRDERNFLKRVIDYFHWFQKTLDWRICAAELFQTREKVILEHFGKE